MAAGFTYAHVMEFVEENCVAVDWTGCQLVEVDPRKVSGAPILRGTRMPADAIVENFRDGLPAEEIAAVFQLPEGSVRDLLAYAVLHDPSLKP